MSWGDVAKEALAKAVESYKEMIRVSAIVDELRIAAADFRKTLLERQESFEKRNERHVERLELRLTTLEQRVTALEGKVTGTLAEAYSVLLKNLGGQGGGPPPPALP